jgi:cyclohexanecarboxyl-CoA dehydrogenase
VNNLIAQPEDATMMSSEGSLNFRPSPETIEFVDTVRKFAIKKLAPYYQENDQKGALRQDSIKDLAEMGLLGLRLSKQYGGQEADCVTTGLVFEEVARSDPNIGYVLNNAALIGEILAANGSVVQHERFLPRIASGEDLPCLCLTEPGHGSDATAIDVRAERNGDRWLLTGEKTSVSLGMSANTALLEPAVAARTEYRHSTPTSTTPISHAVRSAT